MFKLLQLYYWSPPKLFLLSFGVELRQLSWVLRALAIMLILEEKKMRPLHFEKKGLRGLAIAESFRQNSKKSILTGIVMRILLLLK